GDFQYQLQRTNLRPGDIVLLLSDGFPESRNPQGEMIGFEFLSRELLNVTEKSAQEITQYFIDAATEWTDHQPFTDDMTFVVLKKKPSH
ncbi:MAG: SpoIIE family protein phosphatase, partial [Aliifodinibius sp.]|nr:SpoIIE family protein phosphatase [candidate division Zixibacteria bacterium]NIT60589.1 SpoIIE family protein phosphatase [Fodinibius sp.]NIS48535.1 SpoIIE family protein phosphatase [candidate division Zixibacteria bacterium]NIU16623.1 SpoIIE family protein phosphatase [candidate division Zixibacteria bacterium]NIV08775.1 SpoIIE family protein phosphatase [candidate division Zixibacteria bacterium]